MWYGDHMTGWGYTLMALSMMLFWALLIIAVIVLVRYLAPGHRPPPPQLPHFSPEQLLAERFARGEIDAEEYRHRLQTLRDHGRPLP